MDYRFTALLIILLCLLTLFGGPAHSRNDYLNNGTNTCSTGSFDISVEQRNSDYNYRHNSNTNDYDNYSDDQSIRFTWRKYLGSACTKEFREIQTENVQLKQQLELMKMCGKVNRNPTLKHNPSFSLLVSKCSGIIIPENKKPEGSHWDELKDNYKKENPNIKLMGDKFIGPNE